MLPLGFVLPLFVSHLQILDGHLFPMPSAERSGVFDAPTALLCNLYVVHVTARIVPV